MEESPGEGPLRLRRWARFDETRRYRFVLGREWDVCAGRVVWVMLNPSAADDARDDPTIRRCIGFSRAWGFGSMEVVNLFAWRTASPAELRGAGEPVGMGNDEAIREATGAAALVVAAWGVHGEFTGRGEAVRAIIERCSTQVVCLGVTRAGQPRHPLYVGRDVRPSPWARSLTAAVRS